MAGIMPVIVFYKNKRILFQASANSCVILKPDRFCKKF